MTKILIVDDEPKSLYAMEMLLSQESYEILFADNGRAALAQVAAEEPDLLLLDVMMPDMTGYEVCRLLKADDRYKHIPIILVTALNRKEDLVTGLNAGGDEFLTKPVHGPELRARVRSILRIKKQYDEIQEALKLREDMADMIVHDMKSPLSALMLYTDLINRVVDSEEDRQRLIQRMSFQVHRLNSYLGDLLLLAKMRSGRLMLRRVSLDPVNILQEVIKSHQDIAASRGILLETKLPAERKRANLDEKLMQRVLDNLLSNALKFSPEDSKIAIKLEYCQNGHPPGNGHLAHLNLQIADHGPGIPQEYRERIFDKYEVIEGKNGDIPQTGLGLALCKMVVEAHDGRIYVRDNEPEGAVFTIEI